MKNITSFSEAELTEKMIELGQPTFRGKQIYEWLHKHNARSYDEMMNIPKDLREMLEKEYPLASSKVKTIETSEDGTKRYLFSLEDGNMIEAVGMLNDDSTKEKEGSSHFDKPSHFDGSSHLTACVSTQVGCSMLCAFCATGQQGFTRNLTADEIIDQVIYIGNDLNSRVSNVVVMGQGEPFGNYENTIEAIRKMNSEPGLNIGARHITVSTSGIIKGIDAFADEKEQFRLAISLHSAIQSTRNLLMPKLANQTVNQLKDALIRYDQKKGRRVTLEYLLLDEVNDSEKELEALISFCDGLNVHVNLLRYNPSKDDLFEASSERTLKHWNNVLTSRHIKTTYRKSRGSDISAACGQLKNKY